MVIYKFPKWNYTSTNILTHEKNISMNIISIERLVILKNKNIYTFNSDIGFKMLKIFIEPMYQ